MKMSRKLLPVEVVLQSPYYLAKDGVVQLMVALQPLFELVELAKEIGVECLAMVIEALRREIYGDRALRMEVTPAVKVVFLSIDPTDDYPNDLLEWETPTAMPAISGSNVLPIETVEERAEDTPTLLLPYYPQVTVADLRAEQEYLGKILSTIPAVDPSVGNEMVDLVDLKADAEPKKVEETPKTVRETRTTPTIEVEEVRRLKAEGKSIRAIAREMGRSPGWVKARLPK